MSEHRLYILIGEFTGDSFSRSREILQATLRTSALTKAWLYREQRLKVLGTATAVGLFTVWSVFDAWLLFPAAVCLSFKLVRMIERVNIAKGVWLSYASLAKERVRNYERSEEYRLAPIVRNGKQERAARAS